MTGWTTRSVVSVSEPWLPWLWPAQFFQPFHVDRPDKVATSSGISSAGRSVPAFTGLPSKIV